MLSLGGIPTPDVAVGSCSTISPCASTPGAYDPYGCTGDSTDNPLAPDILWGPTDVEIVYTGSPATTFEMYITDSLNGCVRKFTKPGPEERLVRTYEPDVFGVCGDTTRNRLTTRATYLAAAVVGGGASTALHVAYTEGGTVWWHDPTRIAGTSGYFEPKDSNRW
jgi:hypothetical protein